MEAVLAPKIDKIVTDSTQKIIQEQIHPWAYLGTKKGVSVTQFNGKNISYSGLKFFGTPVIRFWSGYIEPFIEDLVVTSINDISKDIKDNNLKPCLELEYLSTSLKNKISNIYKEMQRIDFLLRDEPLRYKKTETKQKNINNKIRKTECFINRHIRMELLKYEERNKKGTSFFNALILQPNFYGIGVDLKKFFSSDKEKA